MTYLCINASRYQKAQKVFGVDFVLFLSSGVGMPIAPSATLQQSPTSISGTHQVLYVARYNPYRLEPLYQKIWTNKLSTNRMMSRLQFLSPSPADPQPVQDPKTLPIRLSTPMRGIIIP
jgi:hypothetical protein